MTTLTGKQIDALKMSEKIYLINQAMESLCEDFQKSEKHSTILETAFPFSMSLDEQAAEVFAWYENVFENEKNIPVIQERSRIEVLHSDTFKNAFHDADATIFVKYFNNDRGAHVHYVFKWTTDDRVPQTFYNGVTFYQTKELIEHEEAIHQFITDSFDDKDAWCWTEESEFIEWMSRP